MAKTGSPSPPAAFSSLPTSSLPHAISVKLDEKNFLLWKQQVEPVIIAHQLHLLLVNPTIPPKYASDADRDSDTVSSTYLAWEQQAAFLLPWLQSTLSGSVLTRMIGCRHSYQFWEKVHAYYHTVTQAKSHQLCSELRNTVLLNRSIGEYLLQTKFVFDSLCAIGEQTSSIEQLDIVLKG